MALTRDEKEAIRSYMLKLVAVPAVLAGIVSFVIGYFVNEIAKNTAYKDAYNLAFQTAAKTISDTAEVVGESKANAQGLLEQLVTVNKNSALTANDINKSKQIVDDILKKNVDKVVDILVTSPVKDQFLKVGQNEILQMREDTIQLKQQINGILTKMSTEINNVGPPISNTEPKNDGGGANPTSGAGRCKPGTFVVGIAPYKNSDGTRRIDFQCGSLPTLSVK